VQRAVRRMRCTVEGGVEWVGNLTLDFAEPR
jgi:hypothetical protein